MKQEADRIIKQLKLQPHPEGGYYRQIFADEVKIKGRSRSSSIYYLLKKGDRSHWHRIDAVEIWHFYSGAPLKLSLYDEKKTEEKILGADIFSNQNPQIIVPSYCWQSAVSLGEWTLVGCTVAPGFLFSNFELAPKGWSPNE